MEGARQLLVEELDTLSAMRGWTVTVSPPLVSGVATSENKITHWRCHPQAIK